MSGINWGQFLNNIMPNINKPNVPAQEVFSQQQISANNEQQINQQMQTLFPNATAQLAQTAAQLAEMNRNQTADILKDFMNMPKHMEQLISQLSSNSSYGDIKTAMFLLTSTLDIMKLSALLKNNSKDAMSNLPQLLSKLNQAGLILKDEQISQISKMLSAISTSSSTGEVQSIKTMLMMYLPWLPLTDPDIFKFEISKNGSDPFSDATDSVTVFIATDNYGNVSALIAKTDEDGVRVDANVSKDFPKEDLLLLIKDESKKYSVNINCNVSLKDEFAKEKIKKSKTKVIMNSSPGVNPFLILISGAFIKHVHNLDSKEKLQELRKEKFG